MSESVLVAHLSRPEYAERVAKDPVVLIPVGSLEQHGPHLPLNVDDLLPSAFATVAAQTVDCLFVHTTLTGALNSEFG